MMRRTLDLPAPLGADDADLGAGQEAQRDIVEDDLVAMGFADLAHGVDEFRHAAHPRRQQTGRRPRRGFTGAARPHSGRQGHTRRLDLLGFDPVAVRPPRRRLHRILAGLPGIGVVGTAGACSMRAITRARSGPTALARISSEDRLMPSRSSYSLVCTVPTAITEAPLYKDRRRRR